MSPQHKLSHSMALVAAERLVNRLVDSIATPPRSPEPLETTPTVRRML